MILYGRECQSRIKMSENLKCLECIPQELNESPGESLARPPLLTLPTFLGCFYTAGVKCQKSFFDTSWPSEELVTGSNRPQIPGLLRQMAKVILQAFSFLSSSTESQQSWSQSQLSQGPREEAELPGKNMQTPHRGEAAWRQTQDHLVWRDDPLYQFAHCATQNWCNLCKDCKNIQWVWN